MNHFRDLVLLNETRPRFILALCSDLSVSVAARQRGPTRNRGRCQQTDSPAIVRRLPAPKLHWAPCRLGDHLSQRLMGTGKSALAALSRRALGNRWSISTSRSSNAPACRSLVVPRRGEASFRSLEREALTEQLADATPRVVSLGGGSLMERGVRLAALAQGTVITLAASPAELVRRLSGDGDRPLLGADGAATQAHLLSILEARSAGYAEAHAVIDTTSRGLGELAQEVLAVAELEPIVVPLGERTYGVDIGPMRPRRTCRKA